MKTKLIITQVLMLIFLSFSAEAQTAAVSNISTHGVGLSPEIAAKLTRIELMKTEKYVLLDEFDMESALQSKGPFDNCYGKTCLTDMGKALGVDYMISGSIDKLGSKIVISIKIIDVKNEKLQMTKTMEFDDQPEEIPRMIEIVLKSMFGLDVNMDTAKALTFKNEVITSTNVGKVSNSGPRFGIAYAGFSGIDDFFMRPKREGGLDSYPIMTNIGYQFEMQYVGTENFSALFEVIPNVAGLEQGNFIPTLSLLNGFRFGQGGWEFAFGPSFGARKMLDGVVTNGVFQTKNDFWADEYEIWAADPNNFDSFGNIVTPYQKSNPETTSRMDTRGDLEFNTNWLMAFGRTFKAGALNIPVNIYYSGNKYGAVIGSSVGFNIITSKKSINQKF